MLNNIFNHQAKTVALAAFILGFSALASRLLGLARDWLLAKTFGAGSELDIYFTVFRMPDFIYHILIAGGIVVAFLPLFSEYFGRDSKKAWAFVNNTLNIFLFFLMFLSLILFFFSSSLIKFLAPGFGPEQQAQAVFLTRILFLSPIFFGLSSVLSGILQYFNRFLIYSLTPILYNLGIIFGIVFLAPGLGVTGVVIGVVLGAFLHFAIQIPSAIAAGFRYRLIFNFRDPGVKRIFLLMLPRTLAVVGLQANLLVITAIASTLGTGSIAIFNFANNIQHIPSGIIGLSIAVAVFPALSRHWVNGQKEEFIGKLSSILRQTIFLVIPISILFFILRNQIIQVILMHGQFSQQSAQLTAAALALFSFSIFAFALIPLISRAFFALQDTKTPALIVFFIILSNIALSFYFSQYLGSENFLQVFFKKIFSLGASQDIRVLGLPLAVSLGGTLHLALLSFFLHRRIGDYHLSEIAVSFLKVLSAGFLMADAAYLVLYFISGLGAFWQILITGIAASVIYLLATYLFRSPELKTIKSSISSQFK